MSIHPSSSFPLRVSDQAAVIQIYLELLRDRYCAGHAIEDITFSSLGSRNHPDGVWPPQELLDLD